MNIDERALGDVTVLDLKGQLTLGDPSDRLKDKINSLIHQNRRQLLVNLGGVSYIDSSGLGQLISAYTTVTRQGGRLALINLTRRTQDLLAITKLLTVFDTYDSEQAAVESFGQGRPA